MHHYLKALAGLVLWLWLPTAAHAVAPWMRATLVATDLSQAPRVAMLIQLDDVDGWRGDTDSYITLMPSPLNPSECADSHARGCWIPTLSRGEEELILLAQTTVLSLDTLTRQYLWLVYEDSDETPGSPLTLSLMQGYLKFEHLKEDGRTLHPAKAPAANITDAPWPILLPPAEQALASQVLSGDTAKAMQAARAHLGRLDCEFFQVADLRDPDACRYYNIREHLASLHLFRQLHGHDGAITP